MEAINAINTLNDSELCGRPIFVREDRELGTKLGTNTSEAMPTRGNIGDGFRVYIGNLSFEASWQVK